MGNRAVITASKSLDVARSSDLGLYLHWNGGRDSVEAFLTYCRIQGFTAPDVRMDVALADERARWERLAEVIFNFFDRNSSVDVDSCRRLDCDNWDNGVYVIEGWEIVDRLYKRNSEQQNYPLREMLLAIDEKQPAEMQLGTERINEALAEMGGDAND